MQLAIERERPFDMFIHLGDSEGSAYLHSQWCLEQNKDCELYFVRGNCDGFTDLPGDLVVQLGSKKAFLTHGHRYTVSYGLSDLVEKAKAEHCDIAMYGHTHRPTLAEVYGVTTLNPGSISEPRQKNGYFTYMVITAGDDGTLDFKHRILQRDI